MTSASKNEAPESICSWQRLLSSKSLMPGPPGSGAGCLAVCLATCADRPPAHCISEGKTDPTWSRAGSRWGATGASYWTTTLQQRPRRHGPASLSGVAFESRGGKVTQPTAELKVRILPTLLAPLWPSASGWARVRSHAHLCRQHRNNSKRCSVFSRTARSRHRWDDWKGAWRRGLFLRWWPHHGVTSD